jgi:[acyl-carrier-protein] S-malonyltransferase
MEPAVPRFEAAVNAGHFRIPDFDVISNVDAQPYRDVDQIKRNLVRSITDEVRWHDAALKLLTYDLEVVVEFGASPVLAPMFKRLPNAPQVVNVTDFGGIEKLRGVLSVVDV